MRTAQPTDPLRNDEPFQAFLRDPQDAGLRAIVWASHQSKAQRIVDEIARLKTRVTERGERRAAILRDAKHHGADCPDIARRLQEYRANSDRLDREIVDVTRQRELLQSRRDRIEAAERAAGIANDYRPALPLEPWRH